MSSKETTAPAPSPRSLDLLGCVYRLVRDFMYDEQCPKLNDNQILRSWQSLAAMPPTDEACIITFLSSVRHGSNAYEVQEIESGSLEGNRKTAALFEHLVQVDFLSSDKYEAASNARRRAQIFEMTINSYYGNSIVKKLNPEFGVLFCDAPMSIAEFDEVHRLRQRHTVTAHFSQTITHTLPIPIVDAVRFELRPVPSGVKQED